MPPRLGKNARGKTAPPIVKKAEGSASTTTAAATASPTENPQFLPPKDAALLAQVFQQYEDKKYAGGVKTADLILKKYPQNAQTLCMKGLSVYNLGKREEGRELAKKGLAQDVKSHVCWHVNALIHRADRDYEDALKCYIQGSRIEPNDLNIMRDKINLQLFLRKYSEAAESRSNLLRLQPRLRYSWTALAVANHLAGDLQRASELSEDYTDLLDNIPLHDVEYSEVVLYKLQVYLEAGNAERAQEVLDREGKRIVDQQAKKEFSAAVLKKLGKAKAAELAYGDLLQDNSDNETYLREYLLCRDVDVATINDSNRQEAINVLSGLTDRFPRNRTIRRLVLDVATEETFRKRLSTYIVDGLNKGIPSLFSELKGLLQDPSKKDIVLHVLQTMRDSIESGKTIEGDDADSSSEESPSTYIWLLYLMSQVYLQLGQFRSALETIEIALKHTPVLPELWMIKARAHKRSGDIYSAEDAMATARALDGQDRFLNGKHVKYLLRIDEITKAEETAGLFTRKDAKSPLQDLTDMQCLWFLLEEAESFRRQGDLGMALKRYHTIEKVFSEIYEDEFDFHAYCMRKFTLRACVNLARSNNLLRKHPAFIKAARAAIDIYLQLDAAPYEKPTANGHDSASADGVSEEERRKAEKKAKKAEAKAKAAAAAEKSTSSAPAGKNGQQTEEDLLAKENADDDPTGEKLWSTRTALKDLRPFLVQLERLGEEVAEAQEIIAKVALREKQFLRAIKALQALRKASPTSPALHERTVELAVALRASDTSIAEPVRSVITQALEDLLPSSVSLEAFNTDYLQKQPGNADAILAAAKAQWQISPSDTPRVNELLMQLTRPESRASLATLKEASAFLKEDVKEDQYKITAFEQAAAQLYPEATAFKTVDAVKAQKQAIMDRRQKAREAGNEDQSS